jgi:hypothetical protein
MTVNITNAGGGFGVCPLGTILPFLKSFAGGLSVPSGWQECDGNIIADGIFAGQNTPNLTSKFLRGAITSGTTDGADTHLHTATCDAPSRTTATTTGVESCASNNHVHAVTILGANNIPVYYEVVFIMRIV